MAGNLVEDTSSVDHNIPVRVNGRTVMMNTQEWNAYVAKRGESGRKPQRFI